MLELLNDAERRTLDAYVGILREALGERLLAVRVFGSVARGEGWPAGMPASPSRGAIDGDAVEVWTCP